MYAACLGLVKQVLPSKESCWLASTNGAVVSSSPGEDRTALQTIVLPMICSSSSGAARGSPCSGAAIVQPVAEGAARQPTAAATAAAEKWSMLKRGQPTAAATQQRTKGIQWYIVKKKKNSCPNKDQCPNYFTQGRGAVPICLVQFSRLKD